jgi:hypothetical protein
MKGDGLLEFSLICYACEHVWTERFCVTVKPTVAPDDLAALRAKLSAAESRVYGLQMSLKLLGEAAHQEAVEVESIIHALCDERARLRASVRWGHESVAAIRASTPHRIVLPIGYVPGLSGMRAGMLLEYQETGERVRVCSAPEYWKPHWASWHLAEPYIMLVEEAAEPPKPSPRILPAGHVPGRLMVGMVVHSVWDWEVTNVTSTEARIYCPQTGSSRWVSVGNDLRACLAAPFEVPNE